MNRQRGLSLLVLIYSLSLAYAQTQAAVAERTGDEAARGKSLYISHCAYCHGIDGTGGRGPALNQPNLRQATNQLGVFIIIKGGLPGTEMPMFWQLSDEEIGEVAGYVWSLSRTAEVNLPGEPSRGKALYEAEGGCSACHIINGVGNSSGPELTAVGARRSAAYLREALVSPGAAAPEGYLIVTAITRQGSKIRGLRVNEDSFTIQIRDAENALHSLRKSQLADLKKEFGVSTMPSYRSAFTASEMDDLVAYLASLRGVK